MIVTGTFQEDCEIKRRLSNQKKLHVKSKEDFQIKRRLSNQKKLHVKSKEDFQIKRRLLNQKKLPSHLNMVDR